MKIAKKVLAAVMAVAMIFALSAMAFAAEPSLAAEASEVNDKGVFTVILYVKDAKGFKSVDYEVNFDANTVEFVRSTAGEYSKFYGTKIGEKADPMAALNDGTKGEGVLKGNLALVEEVYSDADIKAKVDEAKQIAEEDGLDFPTVNLEKASEARFEIITLRFQVKDTAAASAAITIKTESMGNITETVALKEEEVKPTEAQPTEAQPTEAKPTEAPTEEQPSEEVTAEAPSGNVAPDDGKGNKGTGDNMALAAAAGVVVLAGAAFIITKKRK